MKWYTQDNGVLCLGTEEDQSVNFHVATDVVINTKINTALSESHIELIGSFPEDWSADGSIDQKINDTAKHFFGFSEHVSSVAIA